MASLVQCLLKIHFSISVVRDQTPKTCPKLLECGNSHSGNSLLLLQGGCVEEDLLCLPCPISEVSLSLLLCPQHSL